MTTDNELLADHHHGRKHAATQWDWRKVDGRNFITPSQDQGACQASTAFAITDAMNAKLRIQFKIGVGDAKQVLVPDLSAGDLFYCGGGSCSAGQDVEQALGYATDKGVVPSYNIPYKPTGGACGRGPADLELRVTKISEFITLRSRGTMQDAIQSRGPIIATLRAYQDLKNYKSGVYRYNGTAPYLYMQTVSVIGFTPDGWLCKNSWGPSWGTAGVFLIAYGECGIDDERMWEIAGFNATYPYGTVAGTPDATPRTAPLRIAYRDTSRRVQYLSAYPPSKDQPFLLDGLDAGSDPKIAGDASGQIYVVRTDIKGNIQRNVWNNGWSKVQWLTGPEGFTKAPPAVGNSSAVGSDVLYRDADGNIHGVYQSGDQWTWQQVTGDSGIIKAPPAAGDLKLSEYYGGTEVCYRDTDGNIHNLETRQRRWMERPITGNPPRAVGDPQGTVYNGSLRVLYRDNTGKIVHLMYDGTNWRWEYLPTPAAVVAAGDPVFADYGSVWHVFYRESRGFIWHLYWYNNRWNGEQLTGPGLSGGELAEGEPKAVSFGNEIHVLYRDINDNLSDAYWTGTTWTHLVRI
jgi:papain like protease